MVASGEQYGPRIIGPHARGEGPIREIEQRRYLGVGADTGAVVPPLGTTITLSDQIRSVQMYDVIL